MRSWISIFMAMVMFIYPVALLAQSTARLPRPKVAADAHYDLGRGGYPVGFYFEEGKSFSNPTAHGFYEPLIYLVTDDEGGLKHYIDDSGLLLFFRVETDQEFLVNTIRQKLNRTAQEKAKEKIVPGSLEYRISPLTMSEAWFETLRSKHRSSSYKNKAFIEKGEMPIVFESSRQEAQTLLEELERDRDQLLFKYTFSGVSDNVCEVMFKGDSTQDIDLFKQVVGKGDEGFVTRDQTARIADSMVASESLSGRCDSSEWLVYLADKLLGMLSTRSLKMKDGWATVFKITDLDPKDVAADVTRMTKDIKKEASRRIIDESIAEATREGNAWSAETGGMAFGFGLSGSYGEADSETQAEAKKDFSDIMEKMGILGEWKGERYIPKSIDVHGIADLRQQWGRDLKLEYVATVGATAEHSVNLTKESFFTAAPEPQCVGEGSARCWKRVTNVRGCHVWLWNPRPSQESITWSGDCVDGKVSGKGESVSRYQRDGEWETFVAEGTFRDGKLTADPMRYSVADTHYEGQIRDGKRHGRGILELADGRRYVGTFRNDKFHGRGVYTWPSGERYEGEWVNGKYHGGGELKLADGRVYKGQFRNDQKNGHGIFTWPSGERYEGEWFKDKRHGRGKQKMANGRWIKGQWVDGKKRSG